MPNNKLIAPSESYEMSDKAISGLKAAHDALYHWQGNPMEIVAGSDNVRESISVEAAEALREMCELAETARRCAEKIWDARERAESDQDLVVRDAEDVEVPHGMNGEMVAGKEVALSDGTKLKVVAMEEGEDLRKWAQKLAADFPPQVVEELVDLALESSAASKVLS